MSAFVFLAIRAVRATNVQNLRAVRKFLALELTEVQQIPNSGALPSVSSVPSVVRWLRLGRAGQSVVDSLSGSKQDCDDKRPAARFGKPADQEKEIIDAERILRDGATTQW